MVPGQWVQSGAVVGLSGNTGRVFGAHGGYHLHYEQHGPNGPLYVAGHPLIA